MTGGRRRGGDGSAAGRPRIAPITDPDALDEAQRSAAARILESRGELSRPFQLLLHAPRLAERVAELGDVVRFGSGLPDADRELATLATGRAHACSFVWSSHLDAALAAGVAPRTIAALEDGTGVEGRAGVVVAFAGELSRNSSVSDPTFAAALELFGARGVVELAVTIGYYTMLSLAMRAFDAC